MKNENQDNKNLSQGKPVFWTLPKIIVAFAVCTVIAAFVYPFIVRWLVTQFFGSYSGFYWEKYGQFGDSFGFLTAIFTAGAFFLLWKTYKAQQEELRATREIMADQKSVMSMQKFETTFFNFLNLYSNLSDGFIVFSMAHVGKGGFQNKASHGNDAFGILVRGLIKVEVIENALFFICENRRWSQNILAFGQQYRIFITLLDFCFRNCPSATEKERYLKIISSTLVDGEMILLVANCFIENNGDNKKLLNDYFFEDGFYKPSLRENVIDYLRSLLESDAAKI